MFTWHMFTGPDIAAIAVGLSLILVAFVAVQVVERTGGF